MESVPLCFRIIRGGDLLGLRAVAVVVAAAAAAAETVSRRNAGEAARAAFQNKLDSSVE